MKDRGSTPPLRPRASQPEATPSASSATELLRVEATRSGKRVVQLRALSTADGYAVECHVDAVDGRAAEPRPALLHAFATQAEAKAFVDEAAAALQYLGCHVRSGSA